VAIEDRVEKGGNEEGARERKIVSKKKRGSSETPPDLILKILKTERGTGGEKDPLEGKERR